MNSHGMNLRWQFLLATTVAVTILPFSIVPAVTARPGSPFPQGIERDASKVFRDIAKAQYEGMRAKAVSSADASLLTLGDRLLTSAQQLQQSGNYFQARQTAKAATRVYEAARNLGEARTGQALLSRSYYEAPFEVIRELKRTEVEMAYFRGNNATARSLFNQAQQLAQPSSSTTPATADIRYLATNRAAVQLLKASRHLMRAELGF
ncbi:hypothetical protein NIES2134_113680 [Thermostichus vulcanus NIES-2134]|nr:hypothetical protein NIES2134_113680 [Thermostichus vulcanus NIES-2134]